MTKKKDQVIVSEHGLIATVLGKETSFHGSLSFKKPLQISGEFEGEIDSTGYLYISETGRIKADIKAETVVVAGEVTGNITAVKKLEVLPSGKIHGNIKTAKLQMADGVVFDGNCEMIMSDNKD